MFQPGDKVRVTHYAGEEYECPVGYEGIIVNSPIYLAASYYYVMLNDIDDEWHKYWPCYVDELELLSAGE